MKLRYLLTVSLLLCLDIGIGYAQDKPAAAKPFEAGKPLGAVNEAGQFIPLSSNVKVYGSFRFAESCTHVRFYPQSDRRDERRSCAGTGEK